MSTTFFLVASLVISAASFVYSLIQSEKAKDAAINTKESDGLTVGNIQYSDQSEGKVIPIVYGNALIAGNTIWWYAEKFTNEDNNEQYRVALWQTVCMGNLFVNSPHDPGGYMSWSLIPTIDGKYMRYSFLGPGFRGTLSRSYGDDANNQAPPDDYKQYFPSNGPYATRLRGIAHVFIKFFNLPPGVANIPNFKWYCFRRLNTGLPYENGHFVDSTTFFEGWTWGNNPAAIIYDLLTNQQYGLGLDTAVINWDSFVDASNYCYEKKYELNFVINQSISALEIINKIQEWVELFLVKNQDDEYILVYFQDSDADNPQATITDDDMIEFVFRRKSWDETFNSFTANYRNLLCPGLSPGMPYKSQPSFFEQKTASIKDEANINLTGDVRNKVVDLTSFMNYEGVQNRLYQIMGKESYPFATASLTVNLKYSYLQLGNVIIINSNEYGFIGLFRILDVNINEVDKNQIDFELVQVRELQEIILDTPASDCRGVFTDATIMPCLATVTFEPFMNTSNYFASYIPDPTQIFAAWGKGQTVKGVLEYGTDFTIETIVIEGQEMYYVILDPVLYAEEIAANSLGLLTLSLYQTGCPAKPYQES